jgi:hypothetical protein
LPAPHRFSWRALAVAVAVVAVAAIGGAGPAASADPTPFLLGTGLDAPNLSAEVSALQSSAGIALDVESTAVVGGTGVYGKAFSSGGRALGVFGETRSTGDYSGGIHGFLNQGLPGAGSAGVLGSSLSTTDKGPGVFGQHLSGVGAAPGVLGETSSAGAFASGVVGRVLSTAPGAGAAAVRGINNGQGPYGIGVWGSQAGSGWGVYGTSATGYGVVGVHESVTGVQPGIFGETKSTTPFAAAVTGKISGNVGPGAAAVRGDAQVSGPYGIGVWGSQYGSGWGVYGYSPFGSAIVGDSASGYAGYFFGNVYVTGSLLRAAGGSMIDDPLDPAHRYLRHANVESPDMKNIYDGVATTDGKGFAVVKLPAYFQALNKSFRYQLTSLSGLQQVAVAKEIASNRFTIQSEKPNSRVSWQVTGVRRDRYANAHRVQPVELKAHKDQGKYLEPELYGQPLSKRIGARPQLKNQAASPSYKAAGR